MPTPRTLSFEKAHASVIYTETPDCNGLARPKLFIQAIDAYAYQRELLVQYRHCAGDMKQMYWECHAYVHPGLRHITEPSEKVALAFIERFLEQCEKYPTLLFNDETHGTRPRSVGFVHLHNQLALWHADLSAELL